MTTHERVAACANRLLPAFPAGWVAHAGRFVAPPGDDAPGIGLQFSYSKPGVVEAHAVSPPSCHGRVALTFLPDFKNAPVAFFRETSRLATVRRALAPLLAWLAEHEASARAWRDEQDAQRAWLNETRALLQASGLSIAAGALGHPDPTLLETPCRRAQIRLAPKYRDCTLHAIHALRPEQALALVALLASFPRPDVL